MIRDLSNEEQFDKTLSRTRKPSPTEAGKEGTQNEIASADTDAINNAGDSKNELKDEGMKERDNPDS